MKFQFQKPAEGYINGVLMRYGIGDILDIVPAEFDRDHPMDGPIYPYTKNKLPFPLTDGTSIEFTTPVEWRMLDS